MGGARRQGRPFRERCRGQLCRGRRIPAAVRSQVAPGLAVPGFVGPGPVVHNSAARSLAVRTRAARRDPAGGQEPAEAENLAGNRSPAVIRTAEPLEDRLPEHRPPGAMRGAGHRERCPRALAAEAAAGNPAGSGPARHTAAELPGQLFPAAPVPGRPGRGCPAPAMSGPGARLADPRTTGFRTPESGTTAVPARQAAAGSSAASRPAPATDAAIQTAAEAVVSRVAPTLRRPPGSGRRALRAVWLHAMRDRSAPDRAVSRRAVPSRPVSARRNTTGNRSADPAAKLAGQAAVPVALAAGPQEP